MADRLGKKVDTILHKLGKLDSVKTRLDNLDKSMASLEEFFTNMKKDVQNLKDKTTEKKKNLQRRVLVVTAVT